MFELLGGRSLHEMQPHTVTCTQDVLSLFDKKSWRSEAASAAEQKVSFTSLNLLPTLLLTNEAEDTSFCLNACLLQEELKFKSEYKFPARKRGWLQKLTKKSHECPKTRWLSGAEARKALSLFLENEHAALLDIISPTNSI